MAKKVKVSEIDNIFKMVLAAQATEDIARTYVIREITRIVNKYYSKVHWGKFNTDIETVTVDKNIGSNKYYTEKVKYPLYYVDINPNADVELVVMGDDNEEVWVPLDTIDVKVLWNFLNNLTEFIEKSISED